MRADDIGVADRAAASAIRIVIADDHAVMRSGLRTLLDAEDDLEVVAEAADVDAARRCVRGHRPGVLILDLDLAGGASLETIRTLRSESPETQIVVLTTAEEPALTRPALSAGAAGHVLREAADSELADAVRSAAAGPINDE